MIKYLTGNLFESDAQAWVNAVNTLGVMGKGIALQFKKTFPVNFKIYADACKKGEVKTGEMLVVKDFNQTTGEKIIVNFPTKQDWRKPSEYSFIEAGLDDLLLIINKYQITSIAIPALGAGNGGLEWAKVKALIEQKLSHLDVEITVYEPVA